MSMLIYTTLIYVLVLTVMKTTESSKLLQSGKEKCVEHSDCPVGSACMSSDFGKAKGGALKKCIPCSCAEPSQCYFDDRMTQCNCSGSGFTGSNCTINIDECVFMACLNGGTCNDGVNIYTCTCEPGYSGQNCEINIDDCVGMPCLNGGTCRDRVNSYVCACQPGFTGQNCEIIDDCVSMPCANNGSCIDGVDEVTCICTGQFTGQYCETCVPYNPLVNKALNKPSDQINFYLAKWYAEKANDGNNDGDLYHNHCQYSKYELNPWWEVDLLDVYCISKVDVQNRMDCCSDRAQNVEISVAVTYGSWTVVTYQPGAMGPFRSFTFGPVEAQYVRVTLRDIETWLHLCEVEVY
ncbi:fibropellin-1-like isoform X4 [Ruditapes philippinarum]|uniref:fibropellin-1-like isoform X4 n=1 Tax=Ruditapes philippinarum TaxID=129788 RepID=UPI00295A6FE2|nr:fibropellin-1-like isoform X4 [Ruditapes philippinarum]